MACIDLLLLVTFFLQCSSNAALREAVLAKSVINEFHFLVLSRFSALAGDISTILP